MTDQHAQATPDNQIDRRLFLGLAVAAGAAAACPALARTARQGDGIYFDHAPLQGRDDVFSLLGEGGNSLLLNADGHSLLIDCKNAPFGDVLARDIKKLGAHPELTVVNTHHHGDHTAGNHAFLDAAEIIAYENALPRIEGNLDWYRAMGEGAMRGLSQMPDDKRALAGAAIEAYARRLGDLTAADFMPESALTEPQTKIAIGSVEVVLYQYGSGHTDNDLVVHIPEYNIVHTGDLVFNKVNPYMDANGGCDARNWVGVLKNVMQLCDAKTVVVPGHGEVGDRSAIKGQIAYIERIFEAVGKDVNAGMGRDEVVAKTYPFQQGLGYDQGRTVANGFIYDLLQE